MRRETSSLREAAGFPNVPSARSLLRYREAADPAGHALREEANEDLAAHWRRRRSKERRAQHGTMTGQISQLRHRGAI